MTAEEFKEMLRSNLEITLKEASIMKYLYKIPEWTLKAAFIVSIYLGAGLLLALILLSDSVTRLAL